MWPTKHFRSAQIVRYCVVMVTTLFACPTIAQELGTSQQPLSAHEDCNDGQTSRLNRAFPVAKTAVQLARREVRATSPIYRRWFGEWSEGNGTAVGVMLAQIASSWDFTFRCGGAECCDNAGTLACYVVTPWLSRRFYVCHAWHSTPPLSVEANSNRAGTIAHEISHYWGAKDIKDISSCGMFNKCYGADNARNLAKDPTCQNGGRSCKAIDNAENYEHFVSDVLVNTILIVN